jgi:hypothetical protein
MSQHPNSRRELPLAARVFGDLQADDALTPGGVSVARKTSAILLSLMVLATTPLFYAAFAAGVIGDAPTAIAHSNSGPGGHEDDDNGPSGPGGDDDDDTEVTLKTDDTSATGHSTRGTTNDNDTHTKLGTHDTSANGHSTRGTTNDNDTNTNTGTQTQGETGTQTGQTNTNTNTVS